MSQKQTVTFAAATPLRGLVEQYHSLKTQAEECRTKRVSLKTELDDYQKKINHRAPLDVIEKHLAMIAPRKLQSEMLPQAIEELEDESQALMEPIYEETKNLREKFWAEARNEVERLASLAEKALESIPELLCKDYKDTHIPSGETKPSNKPVRPWKSLCYQTPAHAVLGMRSTLVAPYPVLCLSRPDCPKDAEYPNAGAETQNWDNAVFQQVNEVLGRIEVWEKAGGSFFGKGWE